MPETETATGLGKRRARARRLVARGRLRDQLPGIVRRNPLGALKWLELSALGRKASAACYNDPFILQIEVTNRCNLDCRMCPRKREFEQEGIQPANMSFETFQQVLDGWIDRIYQIHLFGRGEPLLAPELPKMIRHAAAHGVPYITFNTNGHLLRGALAEALAASELDELRISIDGSDEQSYRLVRGTSMQPLRENLRAFRSQCDIPISIASTLSRDNWESMRGMPELASELGAIALRLFPVAPYTSLGVEDTSLTGEQKQEYKAFCDDLKARCRAKGINFIAIPHYAPSCNVPFIMTFVDVQGNLTVCCRLETTVAGNVLTDGFSSVWRGPVMRAWRRQIVAGKFPRLCRDLECIHDWR